MKSPRMTNLEGRLSPLDDLPLLSTRLSTAEEAITEVQSEQDIELVITGLPITDTTSPKGAVYAALKLLDGGLFERDILNVRKMRLKPSSEPSTPSDTHAEESRNGYAEESSTMAHQSPPQPIRANAKPRITPLIISLSSHTLAVSLMNAKIKMGKMLTSQLCTELLTQANASPSLPPSLININEWLSPDVHHLRISARMKAKKRGFVIFVNHGKIYIKRKKENHATLIFSAEELESFLG